LPIQNQLPFIQISSRVQNSRPGYLSVVPAAAFVFVPAFIFVPPVAPAPALALFSTSFIVTSFTVASVRHHVVPIPNMIDEINRMSARVVLLAVPVPVLPMLDRNPQIHGLRRRYGPRRRRNDHRLLHDHLRLRILSDVDPPEHSRLAELDRHTDIGRSSSRHQADPARGYGEDSFHGASYQWIDLSIGRASLRGILSIAILTD
jgi:hypothetical protein